MTKPSLSPGRVDELVALSGDLKGELVAFAQGPRYARRLDAVLDEAADRHGFLDETTAVAAIDHFALQHRLSDGSTVVERFAERRRPALSPEERAMVLGWRDVVEGIFEVRRGGALHNLLDDLVYEVRSTMGPRALRALRPGMFTVARLVPLHPDTDVRLVSGHLTTYPRGDGPELARAAAQAVAADPRLLCRNPELLRQGWETQAAARADFVELFGTDLLVLPPAEARERLREYHRRRLAKIPGGAGGVSLDELSALPEGLRDADTVAVYFDETEGLCYYADFGLLDDLFTRPSSAGLAVLRRYLDDESVSPAVVQRLVRRHPDTADTVFRKLLRKPAFTWEADGEALLRRRKKSHYAREPLPGFTPVGSRLAELLRGPGK
ncbi:hypothetical protein [Streptomyces roseirectus]|uniref:hypothetical protein n=1 Tax=Streptomyces roseirectus TaxID=2768066 RepID=UPI001FEB716B|nr:hypothetical protein [Streptomyces roseirectus]